MNIKRIGKAIMVLLLATPALSSMELMAQNLKMPTLEDLLPGGATYRIAENLPGLSEQCRNKCRILKSRFHYN